MLFWDYLDIHIKANTLSHSEYLFTKKIIKDYLFGQNEITWNRLPLNMQEILIKCDRESKIKGFVPKNAQLNSFLFQ